MGFGFGFGFGMQCLSVSVSVSVQTEPKFRYFGFGLNSGFVRSLITTTKTRWIVYKMSKTIYRTIKTTKTTTTMLVSPQEEE